ncbi:hypothetical protein GCM10009123_11360 [Kangiella japonica]|uniref:Methyltransferase domain-containing protein n=1 Tax=Kangiella japonica TaxID=647384 RepID=A0ABN0SXU5_9GAMM
MEHWSNYWNSTQALNSFAESNSAQGYTGEIKDFWDTIFSQQKQGSTVVDIGCGNGALSCLAVEYSNINRLNFNVHAIDAADIDPSQILDDNPQSNNLKQVNFYPRTPVEELPFEESSVDLFISQFGFEYADTQIALEKVSKALKPEGKVILLSHHQDSAVSHSTQSGIEVLNDVLNSSPLFIQVDLLLDIASQVQASGQYGNWPQNPYNQSISTTIRWILDKLQQEFNTQQQEVWIQDIFKRVVSVLQLVGKENPKQLRTFLAEQFKLLNEHCLRLKDQTKATFNDKKIELLKSQAEQFTLKAKAQTFMIQGKPFAWFIEMIK